MAREIPKAPNVHTTKYQNFKGVDFTNDSTNVWYRRSPDAVNMLPDASGRPFKRKGWDILISQEELCDALSEWVVVTPTQEEYEENPETYYTYSDGEYVQCNADEPYDAGQTYFQLNIVDSCSINKCAYFELAGVDHIVIFTSDGVLFYADGGFTFGNKDPDCFSGFDRCFFFEGDGESAFYIYGNFRMWKYFHEDGSFWFKEVTDEITVPTVLIGSSADVVGTTLEGHNLLGTKASITYNDFSLFAYWCSDGLTMTVPANFKSSHTIASPAVYRWRRNNGTWDIISGSVAIGTAGVEVYGTPKNDDEVIIVYDYGMMIPSNVSDESGIKVWASRAMQFDTPMLPVSGTPSATREVQVIPNDTNNMSADKKMAWLKFYSADVTGGSAWIKEIVAGEDFIKVEFPSVVVEQTNESDGWSGTANLVVGV